MVGQKSLVGASQEVFDEVVLVYQVVVVLVLKVSQYVTLLLPEVDQFLELHLALCIENVGHIQVAHKSLSLELLSDLGFDVRHWHIQLV